MSEDDTWAGGPHEFWFNPATGEVEDAKHSAWTDRMGPYPTREAAQAAFARAAERSEAWDEEDRRWRDDE